MKSQSRIKQAQRAKKLSTKQEFDVNSNFEAIENVVKVIKSKFRIGDMIADKMVSAQNLANDRAILSWFIYTMNRVTKNNGYINEEFIDTYLNDMFPPYMTMSKFKGVKSTKDMNFKAKQEYAKQVKQILNRFLIGG